VHLEQSPPHATDQKYPCPCRRNANLVPIYLTDAYGCDRCPQIFVQHEDGKLVEQLTGGYPTARTWRWTGQQWKIIDPLKSDKSSFLRILVPLLGLGLGWVLLGQWLIAPFAWLYLLVGVLVIVCILPTVHARLGRRP
jgi:hypothetical protein